MKKLVIICALVGATFAQAQAQKQGNRERDPEKMAERMSQRMGEKLDLTSEQEAQLKNLFLEEANKRKEIEEARKAEMKAARQSHREQLEAILSPEQLEKWEAEKKEAGDKMRERRKRRRGFGN
jgi:Spy/CpxP family protein refolding chaperone